jgi:hypothetical protein
MFVVEDAAASFTLGGVSFVREMGFETVLRETRSGITRDLSVRDAACGSRGHAGSFLLLTVFPEPAK